jgi:hypothetical protein
MSAAMATRCARVQKPTGNANAASHDTPKSCSIHSGIDLG